MNRTCPTCGKPATEIVGRRMYSADCARSMRLFLAMTPRPRDPEAELLAERVRAAFVVGDT